MNIVQTYEFVIRTTGKTMHLMRLRLFLEVARQIYLRKAENNRW